ncbi:hypothetical protein EGW08_006396 [Elysia chlorotica]|uniref:C2H2-type domain-containing protein n=1 Tax=Elysia chlorotica TaxID=188477 RepID=A0A433TW91_ELYCH|nr:hypothetical protein EGW08_006396 [Elysia chlorotica]
MNIQERQLSRHGCSPDYLTCGDCAREFLLDNISLFIAHKAWGCIGMARTARREGPGDLGEDTSSPLTCSVCSRVFMTARGLLQHVQSEHGMAICLHRGPLIISDKRLPSPGPLPSPDLEAKQKPTSRLIESPQHKSVEQSSSAEIPPSRMKSNTPVRGEGITEMPAHGENDKDPLKPENTQGMRREEFEHDDDENKPKNLSQRSTPTAKSDHIRFSSDERPGSRRMSGQVEVGHQGPEKQPSRSSSVPKKRRYTIPPQDEGCDQEVKDVSRVESPLKDHKGVDYSLSGAKVERLARMSSFPHQENTVGVSDGEGLVYDSNSRKVSTDDKSEIDTRQYYGETKDSESPICLIVDCASDAHESEAERAKNVILKKLLLRNGSTEDGEYLPPHDAHISPPSLLGMPKLEIDTRSLVRNFFDSHYADVQDSAHSASIPVSSSTQKQEGGQRSYLQAPYPCYLTEPSIEQSIDQIIRASVSREIEDLNLSKDSLGHSSPLRPPSSPRYPGSSHAWQGPPTGSYQATTRTMPSLVASRQIGYFSPSPFPTVSPRGGSVGSLPYHMTAGSAGTSPGAMSVSEKTLDATNPLETEGLYPVIHDSSTLPHFGMGYHHKAGMDGLRRGMADNKVTPRAAANPLYSGDVNIHHWSSLAGDAYAGSVSNRMLPEKHLVDGLGLGSDYDESRALLDGRLKKRRYPTSRPFKCPHCDQAFNQRIHLKKHMSKHTGVKPFKCQQCDYSTVERSHLKVHYRIHTGEKPYRCMFCDYATAQNSTLKIHLKRHHEGQQAALKDGKGSRTGRRENHKVSDMHTSDSSNTRESFEGGHGVCHKHHGTGYHGTASGTSARPITAESEDQGPEMGDAYYSMSRSQRQDPRDVDTDVQMFQTYGGNRQANSAQPSSCPRPVMMPGCDGAQGMAQSAAQERRPGSVWKDGPDARQRDQLENQQHRGERRSPVDPAFPPDVSHKLRVSQTRKASEDQEDDSSDPINFSSSNTSSNWKGQKKLGESARDSLKPAETVEAPKESTEPGRPVGADKMVSHEAVPTGAGKPEAGQDDYSDDEIEHVDYDVVKLVIPDKAFVRG